METGGRQTKRNVALENLREYSIWSSMKTRCYNDGSPGYANYGAKGIRVCDRWKGKGGFQNFLFDMGVRPKGTSIDRIDGTRGYEPGNCRWATPAQQSSNLKTNIVVHMNGRDLTLAEVCHELNLSYSAMYHRVRTIGMPLEEAIKKASCPKPESLQNKCRRMGLPYYAVYHRIHRHGWTEERAFSEPIKLRNGKPPAPVKPRPKVFDGPITQERLQYLLFYNPDTGHFKWRNPLSRRVETGGRAGSKKERYLYIRVDRQRHSAHNLAWLYVHGRFPTNLLDHVNGVSEDNRIKNLREATHGQNTMNTKLSRRNTSGVRGVRWNKKRKMWQARIVHNRKDIYLGQFKDKSSAAKAYSEAAVLLFGDYVSKSVGTD